MEENKYWIWLSRVKGFGRRKIRLLLSIFGTPKDVWNATEREFELARRFSSDEVRNLIKSRNEKQIEQWLKELQQKNIQYYSIDDWRYPEPLKNIDDAPLGLYVKGNLPKEYKSCIAIVGARKCSDYGRQTANYFAKELAKQKITVVSGLAQGIDTASHKGTLSVEGAVIAVVANGVDICYPSENECLMKQIIKQGAVISEYPPGTRPIPGFFPERNRIISGLSKGVLVIEAAEKSGSLITADYALEQGREVFAVPGNFNNKLSRGTNRLIQQGAKLVMNIEEILEEVNIPKQQKKVKNYAAQDLNHINSLAPNEILVYDCVSLEPLHVDQLLVKTNFPINLLQHTLTVLELKGFIRQIPGKRFVRNI